MKDQDKVKLIHETLVDFFDQFGKDQQAKVLVETLMGGLFDEETIFVLGTEGQEGDQALDSSQGEPISEQRIEGSEESKSPNHLAEGD